MSRYLLSHLDDVRLEQALSSLAAQDLATTANVVAHLGEAHTRRFFLGGGLPLAARLLRRPTSLLG